MNSAMLIWAYGQICFGCPSKIITWRSANSYDVEFIYEGTIIRRYLQCDSKGRLYVNYKSDRLQIKKDLLDHNIEVNACRVE